MSIVIRVFFVCVLSPSVICGVINKDFYKLDIIHYNDFHDRIEETSVYYPVCKSNDSSCLGGFPRLYNAIQILFKEKPNALLLNAGDIYQGTYWYTLMKWELLQKLFNLLPNDAHALGNHEFDDGPEGLAPFLAGLHGSVVAANLDTRKAPILDGLYKPHVVLDRGGRKIGIIGLITPTTSVSVVQTVKGFVVKESSNPGDVLFLDPIDIVKKEAELLTKEGIDIIIVLSHCGLNVDKLIAKTVGENIDIIVGGHSHSLLWNGPSPSNETVSGPYPVIVETESKPQHKVLITTAACFSKYLGNLTVYFDKSGELQSYDGDAVYLNRSIPEDPKVKAYLQPYADQIHMLVSEVVGLANKDLLEVPCASGECAIGNLIADSYTKAVANFNVSDGLPQVAFTFRNMIRGSISKGGITRGDVINILPFGNQIVSFITNGSYLWETFEECLRHTWSKKPFQTPVMPHVSGMRVTLNTTSGKVVSISARNGNKFIPVTLKDEYRITAPKFVIKGRNGFKNIIDTVRDLILVGSDLELVTDYIKQITPIDDVLDHRLTILQ